MPVITCSCGARVKAPVGSEGRRMRCPRCGAKVTVGSAAPAATILPYLALWALPAVAGGFVLASFGLELAVSKLTMKSGKMSLGGWIVASFIQQMVGIYLMIVSMRIVGLYYLHY